ncbi:MAG: S9 family peptidase [Candidatus Riflebacteria bacterium]|nr:S9 family peptidase [Candidatus Riflebacteria bacterium]
MKKTGYKQPKQHIIDILDTPNTPQLSVSPTGDFALLVEYTSMLTLEDLAEPMAKLAGMRILTRFNIKTRRYFVKALSFIDLKSGEIKKLSLPYDTRFGFPIWAPNGKFFAAAAYTPKGSSVWFFDPHENTSKKITPDRLNSVLIGPFWWSMDSQYIFAPLWHENRGEPPIKPIIPEIPEISESLGKVSQVRTYQDLLQTDYDDKLFEYYAASQLYKIDVTTTASKKFGSPGLLRYVSTSPDGKYTVAKILETPFSRTVPHHYFAHRYELWDETGKLIKVLAHIPVGEEIPIEGVSEGMRGLFWQSLKPSTLCWVEALDGGDPSKPAEFRDCMYSWEAPFDKEPREVIKLPFRYAGTDLLNKENMGIIWDYDRDTKWIQGRIFDFAKTNRADECKKLFGRNTNDTYGDPGDILYRYNDSGETLGILEEGKYIYMEGRGATPEGFRPFLRKYNLETEETTDLFVSGSEYYESFFGFANSDLTKIVVSRENTETSPNYFLTDICGGASSGTERKQLTFYEAPTKELSRVKKELIKYERFDGVPLSGMLYYPVDYVPGKRYPAVIWAYPREYTDVKTAGQVRTSGNRYTRIGGSSVLFFLLNGYIVLNNAEIPVVGNPLTANDTFVSQITAGAEAAVEKLVELGVADRDRIGVAGHSYGAFMVANLLAHTDLFAAGIARSGAYNRTLTPFGFQGERRTYWEAKDIYHEMSPFTYADKIKEPILIIHGGEDQNPGTYTDQSRRLYAAIKGNGGNARLVILPHESHGYEARESIMHVLQEQFDWFDKYVKQEP